MFFLTKLFGDPNKKVITGLQPIVDRVNGYADAYGALTDHELTQKTTEFKARLGAGETMDDLLPEAFAAVREAARRTIGQFHYDVQIMGGIVLHRGQIAEMRTGEGKTLTGTLPVYLRALSGRGVHVVTVNDYLAKRDALWMGQIFQALGLTVGIIQQQMDPADRHAAYAADITYGTNNEFGFDYLRDNMAYSAAEMVQRGLAYAIIDEVDSILIDEARTPLIISAPAEESGDTYYKCAQLVVQLKVTEHFVIDEKQRTVTMTDAGIARMEQLLGIENLYVDGGHKLVHHVDSALRALVLFKRDRDYVVKEGEIIIVDEFTGRLMVGRRYSEGLHQAIEAKEGVEIQRESQTLATITFQNYFRLYDAVGGMTGTAVTEAEEFGKIYALEVVSIPPNKLSQRVDLGDRIYATEAGKYSAVVAEVKERNAKGQPILIGTISIEKNEMLSLMLEREGIVHQVLNAKNHEREGEIIAQAGRRGAVTLATNMAGRGVDIILGGNPPDLVEQEFVRSVGGLFVLGTERHESRRIDNQLRGRSGRQGDPGETQFFISTEDDLMRIFGSDRMRNLMRRLKVPDDMPIEHPLISKSLETAQKKVEGHNFDIRKHLLDYDDVLNRHREVIYKKRRDVLAASESLDGLERVLEIIDELFAREIEQLVIQFTNVAVGSELDVAEFERALVRLLKIDTDRARDFLSPLVAYENGSEKIDINTLRAMLTEPIILCAHTRLRETVAHFEDQKLALGSLSNILLRAIDGLWIEHLEALSYLRTGIGLRGYGQRDPLVEYKRESYRLFQELLAYVNKDVAYAVLAMNEIIQFDPGLLGRKGVVLSGAAKTQHAHADDSSDGHIHDGEIVERTPFTPVTGSGEKVGRNDVCPCGSGKKYKKCHGA